MILLPAIDIIDGKPVRLYRGDYDKKEIVADSVLKTAEQFETDGAEYLHVVDLDGAKKGKPCNQQLILEIVKETSLSVEVGGGIRTMTDIQTYLENGIDRVILGTSAIKDEALLKEAVALYGEKIVVGIDCLDGFVKVEGWLETSSIRYDAFAEKLAALGVKTVIVTDISKDGTLAGPAFAMLEALRMKTSLNIVASGGIRNLDDLKELSRMQLYGAIIGKALYSRSLPLKEALQEVL